MAQELIRTFLAVELPDLLKQEGQAFVDQIRNQLPEFRFVDSKNWHLTLHFFGRIDSGLVERITRAIAKPLGEVSSFFVSLEHCGAFPQGQCPRVFWIGMGQGSSELVQLKEKIDQALRPLRLPIEKRLFQPHITVGRVKSSLKPSRFPNHLTFKGRNLERISEVILFRSDLEPQGARYTALHKFPLAASS